MSHGGIVFGLLLRPSVHSHHRVPTYLNAFVQHSNRHCHNSFLNVVTIEMGWQSKSGMHTYLLVCYKKLLLMQASMRYFSSLMMRQETCVKDIMLSIMSVGFNYGCPAWSTNRVMPGTFFLSLQWLHRCKFEFTLLLGQGAKKHIEFCIYTFWCERPTFDLCALAGNFVFWTYGAAAWRSCTQSQLKWCMMFSLSCSERVAEFCCPF